MAKTGRNKICMDIKIFNCSLIIWIFCLTQNMLVQRLFNAQFWCGYCATQIMIELFITYFDIHTFNACVLATQPKTPQTWCKLWILPAWCNLSTSCIIVGCIKPVDFIKLHQVCEHQTCCNLIFAHLLQVNETICIKPACSSQLAASLLKTCNRLVIIKPEQAMRTHPDIGLVTADLL